MAHHPGDDPFLAADMAERWERWMPVLETGTRTVSEALLDTTRTGQGTRLLDLACGTGATTCAALARGALVTGLDLNPDMLARARKACPATFIEGDMQAPPAGPWDAIVSRFGAHHAPPGWLDAAARVLAPGGRIAIAEWHPDTLMFAGADDGPNKETAEDWVPRFEAAGLVDVQGTDVPFTIDFGDEATYLRFTEEMAHAGGPAPGGRQENLAFVVSART